MIRMRLTLLLILTFVFSFTQAQQTEVPRTEYGHPDFQGTYTFRTITPLQRPPELADKATLTRGEAEAVSYTHLTLPTIYSV